MRNFKLLNVFVKENAGTPKVYHNKSFISIMTTHMLSDLACKVVLYADEFPLKSQSQVPKDLKDVCCFNYFHPI